MFGAKVATAMEVISGQHCSAFEYLLGCLSRTEGLYDRDYCDPCQWRYLCGGVDRASHADIPEQYQNIICAYRSLFIKFSALIKLRNMV